MGTIVASEFMVLRYMMSEVNKTSADLILAGSIQDHVKRTKQTKSAVRRGIIESEPYSYLYDESTGLRVGDLADHYEPPEE